MSSSASTSPNLLELRGIKKSCGGARALRGVSFDLRAGEIHALLGENGAGKSTLIKTLGGIYTPDAGEIFMDGRAARIASPGYAARLGIRVIHQELALAPNLSVAENLFIGREPERYGFIDKATMKRESAARVKALGLQELNNVEARVDTLPTALRQLVEIARALFCEARVLVLDEPTWGVQFPSCPPFDGDWLQRELADPGDLKSPSLPGASPGSPTSLRQGYGLAGRRVVNREQQTDSAQDRTALGVLCFSRSEHPVWGN